MVEQRTHKPHVAGSIPAAAIDIQVRPVIRRGARSNDRAIPAAAILFLSFFLARSVCAAEKTKEPVRIPAGIEWLYGSMGERFDAVIASMAVLTRSGVNLDRTPADYYTALEKNLKRDPSLNEVPLTDLLADIVYQTEPASKSTLDNLRKASKTKASTV